MSDGLWHRKEQVKVQLLGVCKGMLLSLTDWDAFCELRFSQRVSSDTEIDPHISEIIDIERWVDHLL